MKKGKAQEEQDEDSEEGNTEEENTVQKMKAKKTKLNEAKDSKIKSGKKKTIEIEKQEKKMAKKVTKVNNVKLNGDRLNNKKPKGLKKSTAQTEDGFVFDGGFVDSDDESQTNKVVTKLAVKRKKKTVDDDSLVLTKTKKKSTALENGISPSSSDVVSIETKSNSLGSAKSIPGKKSKKRKQPALEEEVEIWIPSKKYKGSLKGLAEKQEVSNVLRYMMSKVML